MFAMLLALGAFDPFGIPAGTPVNSLDIARGNEFAGYYLAQPHRYGDFVEVSVLATEATGVCVVRASSGHIRPDQLQDRFEAARADIQDQLDLPPDSRFPYVMMQKAVGTDLRGAALPSDGWSATWFRADSRGNTLMEAPLRKVELSTQNAADVGNYLSLRIEYMNVAQCHK